MRRNRKEEEDKNLTRIKWEEKKEEEKKEESCKNENNVEERDVGKIRRRKGMWTTK
jgi:hypothetical protein